MTSAQLISRVVVVGRDADLWLCVNALRRELRPAGVSVVAVELPTRLRPAQVSATLPPLEALHAKLGIAESGLIRATGGSFSLGQNIVGSADSGPSIGSKQAIQFFHAWGAYGAPVDGSEFFPCWLKARRAGMPLSLQNFCLTAVAALNGRMLVPDKATAAFGRTDYGYHLPTAAYVGYLKSMATRLGVKAYEARGVMVERAGADSVAAVIVDGSARIEGQLFADATGEDAILIGHSLGVPWESWQQHFSVDRVLSVRAPAFTSTPPFAEIRATRIGWTALHPSQIATGVVQAYSSRLVSDEAALQSATVTSGTQLTDAFSQSVGQGLRSKAWEGNCIAVGRSACALDPIYDVELHTLQLGLVHLLALFPGTEELAAERAEYNRVMRSYYERVRDFQCAFYNLAPFDGEFWQMARGRAVPQPLAHKIATFRARGIVAPLEDETFLPESWQAILVGLGVMPESWPPAVDRIAPQRLQQEFRGTLELIQRKVLEQPTHNAYLESLCRSSVA